MRDVRDWYYRAKPSNECLVLLVARADEVIELLFAAVHESVIGTKRTIQLRLHLSAIGAIADKGGFWPRKIVRF
jgi:hypothetical protein